MQIRTLIVDDEPHAIEILLKYAANIPEIRIVATCSNAIEAFQMLQRHEVDLLLVDIKMPGLTGTDLVRSLKSPPMVIFTTAYHEFAVEGFDLNAVDYLVKPIPLNRFLRAIDKVMHQVKGKTGSYEERPETPAPPPVKHFLYLRIDRQTVKVDTEDIHWIESIKDYIKVVTRQKIYIAKQKISVVEKLLPMDQFIRIHRSFIVPESKVEGYNPNYLVIAGSRIPVGRNYKQACMEKFNVRPAP
ncbi:LytTR family DNA-binding domain-containing protein [Chitinophaga pollutisoli]|uniref:LytTR family DNA-binding domain-containing protein n=1 Tax=Chitinophaga pollutisoli TaxID=3133966 RepID=A0ABZ2YML6_9BACT